MLCPGGFPPGQSIYNGLFQIGVDIASDDALPGPRARNPDVRSLAALTYATTNDRVSEIWKQHYDAINRANIAVDNIPLIQMDTALSARLVREAKFLRAIYYFNLVRLYGGVPLVLHKAAAFDPGELNVKQATADEVYAQMMLGLGGIQSGQYDKAAERFLTVVQKQPDNIEAVLDLAGVYERLGKKAEAIKWYKEASNLIQVPQAKKDIEERIKFLQ